MLTVSVISFIVALSVLVVVHEWGHFLMARRNKIPVERFSIGFGPRLFGWKKKETDFCISLLPLGGYVKLLGEEGEKESQTLPDSFPNKPVWQRLQVVTAGPIMNLLFAFLLLPFVFWMGQTVPEFFGEKPVVEEVLPDSPAAAAGVQKGDRILAIGKIVTPEKNNVPPLVGGGGGRGKAFHHWEEVLQSIALYSGQEVALHLERAGKPLDLKIQIAPSHGMEAGYLGVEPWIATPQEVVVMQVKPGSPADIAGIKAKDRILTVNGVTVANWEDMKRRVQKGAGAPLKVILQRDQETITVFLTPEFDSSSRQWLIGIQGAQAPFPKQLRQYGFLEGLKAGWQEAVKLIGLTLDVVKKLVTLQLSYKSLGGPVQIAYSLAQASASGFADFLYFVSFLSIQLGILNLLPIPVLDGGHIVFLGIEAVLRKPMSMRARLIAQQVGMALLLTLILFVTFNDLDRLLGIRSWFH